MIEKHGLGIFRIFKAEPNRWRPEECECEARDVCTPTSFHDNLCVPTDGIQVPRMKAVY